MVYSVSCWTCDYSACFIYKSLQHDFQITLKWVHLICSLLPCFAVCLYFPSLTLFSSTPLLFIPIPLSYSSSTSLLSSGLPSPRGVGQLWPTDSSLILWCESDSRLINGSAVTHSWKSLYILVVTVPHGGAHLVWILYTETFLYKTKVVQSTNTSLTHVS